VNKLLAALGLGLIVGCGTGAPTTVNELVDSGADPIRIQDVHYPLEWDRFNVFSPYTSKRDVCREMIASWPDCNDAIKGKWIPEGQYLLVFENKNAVVHVEHFDRSSGDFCDQGCVLRLMKDQAVFYKRGDDLVRH